MFHPLSDAILMNQCNSLFLSLVLMFWLIGVNILLFPQNAEFIPTLQTFYSVFNENIYHLLIHIPHCQKKKLTSNHGKKLFHKHWIHPVISRSRQRPMTSCLSPPVPDAPSLTSPTPPAQDVVRLHGEQGTRNWRTILSFIWSLACKILKCLSAMWTISLFISIFTLLWLLLLTFIMFISPKWSQTALCLVIVFVCVHVSFLSVFTYAPNHIAFVD